MTRPLTNTVQYFPHTTDHGNTIYILENRFGITGYAFWYKLLEMLGKTENHFLDLNDPLAFESLQAYAKIQDEITTRSLLDLLALLQAINPELWKHGIVWSENFVLGVKQVYDNRKRELPKKPVITNKEAVSTSSNPTNEGINTVVIPQGKVRKGKEGKKGKKTLVATPKNQESQRLTNLLFQKILDRNPNHKTPNFDEWCKHLSLMINTDKRDPSQIEKVIEWCQDDSFWQNNILSTQKLRKQYDQLVLKMDSGNGTQLNQTQRSILESEARARERRKANINQKELT